jgi:hypothetical protein
MSVLAPKIQKLVHDEQEKLIREQITPWIIGFAAGELRIKNFHGKEICYGGIRFEGTPTDVFWGKYIDPFLENAIARLSECIAEESEKNKLPFQEEMRTLQTHLRSLIAAIFKKMAEADQRMRGIGSSKQAGRRNVDDKIKKLNSFLHAHIDMEIEKHRARNTEKKKGFFAKWWADPVGSKVIAASIIAGGSILIGAFNYEAIKLFMSNSLSDILQYINMLAR